MKYIFVIILGLLIIFSTNAVENSTVVPGVFLVKSRVDLSNLQNIAVSAAVPIGVDGIYKVRLNPGLSPAAGVKVLSALANVEQVEPLRLYKLQSYTPQPFFSPNDPLVFQQWHLDKVMAPQAWNASTGNADVVVAVIDTGVEANHEDLVHCLWHNPGEIPGNHLDDDHNGLIDDVIGWDFIDLAGMPEMSGLLAQYGPVGNEDYVTEDNDPADVHGHGTHISGIIAAAVDNGVGVAGVAPGVKVMVLKAGFLTASGGYFTSEAILRSLDYARRQGARIVNMSWGDIIDDALIHEQLQLAHEQGMVLVAAAGNDHADLPNYPAAIPFVIAVGATTKLDNRADFSNFGRWVDVAAPGGGILSTISNANKAASWQVVSNLTNKKYALLDGTSMAAPIVSGLSALMLSVNPELSADGVDYILKKTADSMPAAALGAGRINFIAALQYLTDSSSTASVASGIIRKLYIVPNPVDRSVILPVQFKLLLDAAVSEVEYALYSQSGSLVYSGQQQVSAVEHSLAILWDGRSNQGEDLSGGLYYLRVKVKGPTGKIDVAKAKCLVIH